MKRRESALEQWAVKYARSRGIVVAKMTLCNGVPDRVFFTAGGRPLIVEFKARGEEPSETQAWYLDALTAAGYVCWWCNTREEFLELWNKKVVNSSGKTKKTRT